MREAKTEGKIKGAARMHSPSQSARGLRAAPRWQCWVLRGHAMPHRADFCHVLPWICCAMPCWILCHGFA